MSEHKGFKMLDIIWFIVTITVLPDIVSARYSGYYSAYKSAGGGSLGTAGIVGLVVGIVGSIIFTVVLTLVICHFLKKKQVTPDKTQNGNFGPNSQAYPPPVYGGYSEKTSVDQSPGYSSQPQGYTAVGYVTKT